MHRQVLHPPFICVGFRLCVCVCVCVFVFKVDNTRVMRDIAAIFRIYIQYQSVILIHLFVPRAREVDKPGVPFCFVISYFVLPKDRIPGFIAVFRKSVVRTRPDSDLIQPPRCCSNCVAKKCRTSTERPPKPKQRHTAVYVACVCPWRVNGSRWYVTDGDAKRKPRALR